MTNPDKAQLPPLPEPAIGFPWRINAKDGSAHASAFTGDQMQAYALSALSTAPAPATAWENFPAYLIDHCEGETISEEGLQRALADMLSDPKYAPAPAPEAVAERSKPYGIKWLKLQPRGLPIGSELVDANGVPHYRVTSLTGMESLRTQADVPHGTKFYMRPPTPAVAPSEAHEVAEECALICERAADVQDAEAVLQNASLFNKIAAVLRECAANIRREFAALATPTEAEKAK